MCGLQKENLESSLPRKINYYFDYKKYHSTYGLFFSNIEVLGLISLLMVQQWQLMWSYWDRNSLANRAYHTVCDLNRKSMPIHVVFHSVNVTFQNVNVNNMGKFLL